jgi:hypothetical protein
MTTTTFELLAFSKLIVAAIAFALAVAAIAYAVATVLIRQPRKVRCFLAAITVPVVLMPLAWGLIAHGMGQREQAQLVAFDALPSFPSVPSLPSVPFPPASGSAWLAEVEEVHHPSIFPSVRSAAAGLGRRIADVAGSLLTQDLPNQSSVLIAPRDLPHADRDAILNEIQHQLQQHLESCDVRIVDGYPEDDSSAPVVSIGMQIHDRANAPWCTHRKDEQNFVQLSGTLSATVHCCETSSNLVVDFVEKPWVSNYAEFVSSHPSGGRYQVKALSRDLTPLDQEDARRQAIQMAATRIAPLVRARALQRAGGSRWAHHLQQPSDIAQRLVLEMADGRYIADEFSQELEVMGGHVWRHAILVELSPRDLEEHAVIAISQGRRHRVRTLGTIASFAGLTVFTGAVYLFLNAATRGYFREALLAAAGVIILIGGAALFLIV